MLHTEQPGNPKFHDRHVIFMTTRRRCCVMCDESRCCRLNYSIFTKSTQSFRVTEPFTMGTCSSSKSSADGLAADSVTMKELRASIALCQLCDLTYHDVDEKELLAVRIFSCILLCLLFVCLIYFHLYT